MSYEGFVKFTDGSVISVQCAEGRCAECPDGHHEDGEGDVAALDGYYCEHGCRGADEPLSPEARLREQASQSLDDYRDTVPGSPDQAEAAERLYAASRALVDHLNLREGA